MAKRWYGSSIRVKPESEQEFVTWCQENRIDVHESQYFIVTRCLHPESEILFYINTKAKDQLLLCKLTWGGR